MKPINLWGSGLRASSPAIAAENRLNCIYEIRKDGSTVIRGTPGSVLYGSVPVGPIRGKWVVNGVLYVVAASNLYSFTSLGVVTYLGALSTSSGTVGMSDNFVQLAIVDGTAGYIFTIASSTFAVISDSNFPNGATTIAFLNGVFICEKPSTRTFYVSNLLDGTNWTTFGASVFANKEQYSDILTAVDSFNGILILWGPGSTEYWQDAGTSPNPFALIPGSTQKYGLYAKYSRVIIDNSLFFLGIGNQGGITVFSITNYAPQSVSTPDVEDLLNTLALTTVMTDAVALAYSVDGHDIYQITFPTANLTLIYDVTSNLWSRAQTGVLAGRHFASSAVTFNNNTIFSDATTGNLYLLSIAANNDAGTPAVRQVTTKHLRNGGDEFSITELMLQMDTGHVPTNSNYSIFMEVSRDGGNTFGSPRPATLGAVGQYKTPRVRWTRMGSAEDFVLRFTLTDPVPFIIAGAEIETSAQ